MKNLKSASVSFKWMSSDPSLHSVPLWMTKGRGEIWMTKGGEALDDKGRERALNNKKRNSVELCVLRGE